MQKLFFIAVLLVAVVGITSRHHLNKLKEQLAENDGDVPLTESLKDSQNRANLSQAFNQVMANPPKVTAPVPAPLSPPNNSQKLASQVDVFVKQIQDSTTDSPYSLEKALSLTSGVGNESFRLTVLQAAMALQGDDNIVRSATLGVASSTSVQNPIDRDIVETAYRVYLQESVDPLAAYSDTMQILNSQTDAEVKSKVTADCINKFPQLRERFQ
jgi:hypothetical protein